MADAVTIQVEARDPAKNKGTGSRVSRKLRASGRIPAIVYGHKEAPQPIALTRDAVWEMIKKRSHLAQLQIDGATQMVIVRDIQWDYLGKEILHLDFARVSADESIETEVRLVLHGTAPGVAEGGVLEQPLHAVEITCRANAIPDAIRVEIGDLHLGKAIHVRELALPEGVSTTADGDLVVVHVVNRAVESEPEAGEGSSSEPELIGRKPEDKDEAAK
jgi:large subunit ribosomal protein L25